MTDKEIIQKIENEIKYSLFINSDYVNIARDVLMAAASKIYNKQAEIERLTSNIEAMAQSMPTMAKADRAEAVKEFAERFKEKIRDIAKIDFQGGYYYLIGEAFVDNLVKEMVGEG